MLETEENMPLGILPWSSRAHASFLSCLVPININPYISLDVSPHQDANFEAVCSTQAICMTLDLASEPAAFACFRRLGQIQLRNTPTHSPLVEGDEQVTQTLFQTQTLSTTDCSMLTAKSAN